jgi:hypothetical protein
MGLEPDTGEAGVFGVGRVDLPLKSGGWAGLGGGPWHGHCKENLDKATFTKFQKYLNPIETP